MKHDSVWLAKVDQYTYCFQSEASNAKAVKLVFDGHDALEL
jgi:hypothetical protein